MTRGRGRHDVADQGRHLDPVRLCTATRASPRRRSRRSTRSAAADSSSDSARVTRGVRPMHSGCPRTTSSDGSRRRRRSSCPLLRAGHADVEGVFHAAHDLEQLPVGPRPGRIPIMIGAKGPRMLRVAASHADVWSWFAQERSDVAAFAPLLEALVATCRRGGPRSRRRSAARRASSSSRPTSRGPRNRTSACRSAARQRRSPSDSHASAPSASPTWRSSSGHRRRPRWTRCGRCSNRRAPAEARAKSHESARARGKPGARRVSGAEAPVHVAGRVSSCTCLLSSARARREAPFDPATNPTDGRDGEAIDTVAGHVAGLRVALPVVERHAAVGDLRRAVRTGQGAELPGDAGTGRRLTRRGQRRPGRGAAGRAC